MLKNIVAGDLEQLCAKFASRGVIRRETGPCAEDVGGQGGGDLVEPWS